VIGSGTTLHKAGIMGASVQDCMFASSKGRHVPVGCRDRPHKGGRLLTPGASFSRPSPAGGDDWMPGHKSDGSPSFSSPSRDRRTPQARLRSSTPAIRSRLRFQLAAWQHSLVPACHDMTVIRLSLRLPLTMTACRRSHPGGCSAVWPARVHHSGCAVTGADPPPRGQPSPGAPPRMVTNKSEMP
jgi:hypothetical protein